MPSLLITGSNGQLGREFTNLADKYPAWTFLSPARATLDICDEEQVRSYFEVHKPNYCLNTAAYTAVDKAEEQQKQAFAVNADAAGTLAQICYKSGTHLIHYSTDYVYQQGIDRPRREDDPVSPLSVYAASKLKGDQLVTKHHPLATIIRTSWVYSAYGHNFVKTMLRLGKERKELRVVFDQIGSPTYAHDLARASLQFIEQIEHGTLTKEAASGIFHYSNEGVCSWYDFAKAIFEIAEIDCEVLPIESTGYPTPAQRPAFSVLNKAKFKEVSGLLIPHWRDALQRCLSILHTA